MTAYGQGAAEDEPLVWYEGTGTTDRRFLHADERGSIVATSDSTGAVTTTYAYDEYGIPRSTDTGRFRYTGQTWLPELGMYYYKARIYSPTLGRFLQPDPIGYEGGLNLYGYVGSDPVNFKDPSGLCGLQSTNVYDVWNGSSGEYLGQAEGPWVSRPDPNCDGPGFQPVLQPLAFGGGGGGGLNLESNPCPRGMSADLRKPSYKGVASMYGQKLDGTPDNFAGKTTKSGEPMNPNAMTAASVRKRDGKGNLLREPVIPMQTIVVVNLQSDATKSIVVRINDTGPLTPGRILDLSPTAMKALTGKAYNTQPVNVYMCRKN